MSRRIRDLDPKVLPIVNQFAAELEKRGIRYAIIETRRSMETQIAYYAQGREPVEAVNAKRRAAGLSEIGESEAKRIVTKTLRSKHIDGLAADIVPLTSRGAIPWAINSPEVAAMWKRLGEIGESVGLEWGGHWTPLDRWGIGWDAPHYQWRETK